MYTNLYLLEIFSEGSQSSSKINFYLKTTHRLISLILLITLSGYKTCEPLKELSDVSFALCISIFLADSIENLYNS